DDAIHGLQQTRLHGSVRLGLAGAKPGMLLGEDLMQFEKDRVTDATGFDISGAYPLG
ncbi:MAG: hypothetical protein F6K39_47395, partial [Okeania sp. SIO3B3]|nr:hypothetical protein [Okeania sp. SIO3B3]